MIRWVVVARRPFAIHAYSLHAYEPQRRAHGSSDTPLMQPFLKWPGGKRWFVSAHADLLPKNFGRYFEPFLGGGAVYFQLKPSCATLGDVNPDLVAVYKSIKKNWPAVVKHLRAHQREHCKRYYYKVRRSCPANPIERAARLIYLNRTCFNGIYRVNRDGDFNVPKGTKKAVLLDTDDFKNVARLLSKARIQHADFGKLISQAERGDFVFADPPYTVRHNNNAFVKYNETLFSWADQERLATALTNARKRGVKIVATNANHKSIRDLYKGKGFQLLAVSRYSSISAAPDSRKQYDELVILGNVEATAK